MFEYDAVECVSRIRRGSDVLHLSRDGLSRLVSVSTNGVVAESYRYDALGRRTATTNAEGTERHVWDGDHCLADIDERGEVIRAYLWGPGVDNLLAVRVGGRNYAALTDIQGTVWGYADERDKIVARWTYDAWGNLLSEEVSVPALAAVRYRFQGREFSRATGLTNFRASWYDSVTGRWLSKDPIRLSGGLNLYEFCANNPINLNDPFGLWTLSFGWGIRGSIIFGGGFEIGVTFDSNGDFGIYGKVSGGFGLEISTPIKLPKAISGSSGSKTCGNMDDLSGVGTEAHSGIFVGGTFNLDKGGQLEGLEVGAIGGGVYKTYTKVITIGRLPWCK